MLFAIGIVLMSLGWWAAWFFGDWINMDQNIWDRLGTAAFSVGLGLCVVSVMIAAIKYLP